MFRRRRRTVQQRIILARAQCWRHQWTVESLPVELLPWPTGVLHTSNGEWDGRELADSEWVVGNDVRWVNSAADWSAAYEVIDESIQSRVFFDWQGSYCSRVSSNYPDERPDVSRSVGERTSDQWRVATTDRTFTFLTGQRSTMSRVCLAWLHPSHRGRCVSKYVFLQSPLHKYILCNRFWKENTSVPKCLFF